MRVHPVKGAYYDLRREQFEGAVKVVQEFLAR
jgi:hypothetical protein